MIHIFDWHLKLQKAFSGGCGNAKGEKTHFLILVLIPTSDNTKTRNPRKFIELTSAGQQKKALLIFFFLTKISDQRFLVFTR